jgi:MATE family multidrug resistance protein
MQNTRFPMVVSIVQNVANILVSLMLVYGFGMKVEGVALGTLVAQYVGFLSAVFLLLRYYGRLSCYFRRDGLFRDLRKFFGVNRDIFLRTLCLVSVTLYFTSAGARSGAVILAVNTVLMQFYLFFSYFMDGFAYAGEALGGRAYGAGNRLAFRETLRRLFLWSSLVTLLYTLVYVFAGQWIVETLTDEPQVLAEAGHFLPWVWVIPAAGAAAFIWDGIFIGITASRGMLVSSFVAAVCFFSVCLSTRDTLGNHGLWLAFVVYLAMRGVLQTVIFFFKK